MKEHITDKAVKAASSPKQGAIVIYDDEIKGFGLRVTYRGTKAFVLNYSINGRERRFTIGGYPEWSVTAARGRAKDLRQEIDRGIDPQGQKVEERLSPTVKDLHDEYVTSHLVKFSPASQKDTKGMWKDYILPALGTKRLKDLTGKDIDKLHRHITKHAPIRANRVLGSFRSALNLAIRWGMIEKNPALGFKKNPEHPKNTYLTPEQIAKVFDCLQRMENQKAANIIRLLIFTGARFGEVVNAEWSHFDLTKGEWIKPPSKTKQRRVHRVPLSVEAVALLRLIKTEAEKQAETQNKPLSPLVFESNVGKPIKDVKKPWIWLLNEVGLEDIRIHDLRHTFASLLVSQGEGLPVIGRLLGHSQHQTTLRYAKLMDDPLRRAIDKISQTVLVGRIN